MAKPLFANNAGTTLAVAINSSVASLTVATGTGALFPAPTGGDSFAVTLYTAVGVVESAWEVMTCTARTGDVLTVTRAQEGTTARSWAIGAPVEARLTAGIMTVVQSNLDTLSAGKLPNTTTLAEIGADLVDADEFPVYDASAAGNRKSLLSRVWTYIQGKLAAPGPIGGATPAAGAFTTLSAKISRTSSTSAAALLLSDNVTGIQTDGVYKAIRSESNGIASVSEIRFIESEGTNNDTAIGFATQSPAGGLTERMRISRLGNVLIGTSTEAGTGKLQVAGDASISGALVADTTRTSKLYGRPSDIQSAVAVGMDYVYTFFPSNTPYATYLLTVRGCSNPDGSAYYSTVRTYLVSYVMDWNGSGFNAIIVATELHHQYSNAGINATTVLLYNGLTEGTSILMTGAISIRVKITYLSYVGDGAAVSLIKLL